jgi:DNA-binding HxlR family transcriptional regulator
MKEVHEVQTKQYAHPTVFDAQYGSRQVLDLLAEKWTGHVLYALAFGRKRDGMVQRTVYHVVPPRVEYALTPLGETLSALLKEICTWADTHFAEIEDARGAYDHKSKAGDS